MGKTVLLTGAGGFIARHTVLAFLRAGYDVRGTIRNLARADPLEVWQLAMDYWQLVNEYCRYYWESIVLFWRTLRPGTYTAVLLAVWAIGFALLKSGARR